MLLKYQSPNSCPFPQQVRQSLWKWWVLWHRPTLQTCPASAQRALTAGWGNNPSRNKWTIEAVWERFPWNQQRRQWLTGGKEKKEISSGIMCCYVFLTEMKVRGSVMKRWNWFFFFCFQLHQSSGGPELESTAPPNFSSFCNSRNLNSLASYFLSTHLIL